MKQGLPAALIVLSAAISIYGQDSSGKHNQRPNQAGTPPTAIANTNSNADPVKYTYEFSQPKFYVKHIVVEHDANGRGTVTFEGLNEDTAVTEPLELSPAALARITASWQGLQFLVSTTDYPADQQFPQ